MKSTLVFDYDGSLASIGGEDTLKSTFGHYEIIFNPSNFSSGIYLCRLSAVSVESRKEFHDVKKMVLIK